MSTITVIICIFIGFCVITSCGILQAYEVEEAAKTQAGREKAIMTIQRNGKVYLLSEHNPDDSKPGYYKTGKTTKDVNKHFGNLQGGNPHKINHVESHEVPIVAIYEGGHHAQVHNAVGGTLHG